LYQAEQPSPFAPKLLHRPILLSMRESQIILIARVAKDSLYVRTEWNPDRRRTCVDLAKYFCAAKPLLLSMASDSLKRLASTCFLLYCSISPVYSDRTSPGLSSRHFRKSSTGDKSISTISTKEYSRYFLSHVANHVQAGSANAHSDHDDGHRFDRQSDRFMSKAL
jgi:hypothetical protein